MKFDKILIQFLITIIGVISIGVAAQISISLPESMSVVPITAQSLAVLLIAHLLGWKHGSLIALLYIIAGALGLPVFSDASAGMDVVLGKSMGYLIGFILGAIVVGHLAQKQKKRFGFYLLQMTIGNLLVLFCGLIGLLRYLSFSDAFLKGVLPYLPGAIVKVVIAAILLSLYARFSKLMRSGLA